MHQQLLQTVLLLPVLLRSAFAATACNNSPLLCDKAYNNVTYLGAHDSPFLRDAATDYSESGNQFYNSTVQLSAGVRLLTAQVHNSSNEWHLCHTSCELLDAGLLSDWLGDIRDWMADNPNEVVTILLVNSDDATSADLAAEYTAADIVQYSYEPDFTSAPETWPTLQTLINKGSRLINFVASLTYDSNYPYLLDEFTYIFENPYDNSSPENFTCTAQRPSSVDGDTEAALNQNLMPLMNHFLYTDELLGIEVPDVDYINTTNAASGGTGNLGTTAAGCASTYGRAPTYVLVDFFNEGPAIDTVDSLNGVTNATGRTAVSTSALSAATADSGSGAGRGSYTLPVVAVAVGFAVLIAGV